MMVVLTLYIAVTQFTYGYCYVKSYSNITCIAQSNWKCITNVTSMFKIRINLISRILYILLPYYISSLSCLLIWLYKISTALFCDFLTIKTRYVIYFHEVCMSPSNEVPRCKIWHPYIFLTINNYVSILKQKYPINNNYVFMISEFILLQ